MKIYTQENNFLTIKNQDGSGMVIPMIDSNTDYLNVLREVQEGLTQIVPYTPPPLTWEQIRAKRNELITQTDWTLIVDVNPKPNKQAWIDYRQALRDIPQNFTNPQDVVWPTKPE